MEPVQHGTNETWCQMVILGLVGLGSPGRLPPDSAAVLLGYACAETVGRVEIQIYGSLGEPSPMRLM